MFEISHLLTFILVVLALFLVPGPQEVRYDQAYR